MPPGDELVLGVDVGTTLVKAAIYAPDGSCLGRGEAPQVVVSPRPGWVEQDPNDWWDGLCRATADALARAGVPGERIAGIGVSTQGGTFAIFDQQGTPRGPALVWSDGRLSRPEVDSPKLREEHFQVTGVSRRSMTPAGLSWMKAHRPGWFAPPYRVAFVPDYLTFRLAGEWVSDSTNLGISNLHGLSDGDIALPVLTSIGVPREAFARTLRLGSGQARRAGEVAGLLQPAAARVLGLVEGIPVATPAHDQYAAALGAGCVNPGDLLLSAGTAWALLMTSERPIVDRKSSFWPGRHVQNGRWGLMGAISSGGSTLDMALDVTGQPRDWAQINAGAGQIPPGSDGLMMIPHLTGRTLPTSDPGARGALLGWSLGHRREHLWRAAMEGVVLDVKVACGYLAEHGADMSALRMVGGAARSPLWADIVASVLEVSVSVYSGGDIAVRGAACLARRALGETDLPAAAEWSERRPVPEWREVYREQYETYTKAVGRLEDGGLDSS